MTTSAESHPRFDLSTPAAAALRDAAIDTSRATDGTHWFYNYPAKLSPVLVREVIGTFSRTSDLIVDPFVGGGTTAVEAKRANRHFLGTDVNSLAAFVSTAKTTSLSPAESSRVLEFARRVREDYPLRSRTEVGESFMAQVTGALNFRKEFGWRVPQLMAALMDDIAQVPETTARTILRCALLRLGQWIVETRGGPVPVSECRKRFASIAVRMSASLNELSQDTHAQSGIVRIHNSEASSIVAHLRSDFPGHDVGAVITSPPYPNVHVLYHRWQIRSRRETNLPYILTGLEDGQGESHYTLGGRNRRDLTTIRSQYFAMLSESYKPLIEHLQPGTPFVQVVAFRQPDHLDQYLSSMRQLGLEEITIGDEESSGRGQIWRSVPSRRWYARGELSANTGQEVVLLHVVGRRD